jgi:hypothetical protein
MSNHINDTPRTDAEEYESQDEPITKLGSVDAEFARSLERHLNGANDRIKRLEEELIDAKGQWAALVADVVLYEDRGDRINHLETALRRIANADYRGNRSTESQIAFRALEAKP